MGLRAFTCWAGFCAMLFALGEAQAREQVSSEVRNWLSAIITALTTLGTNLGATFDKVAKLK